MGYVQTKRRPMDTYVWTAVIWSLCVVVIGRPGLKENDPIQVLVDSQKSVAQVGPRFLSIALGSSIVREHWSHWKFSSKRLHTLARGLSPAYMRLGGTDADFLIYRPTLHINDADRDRTSWHTQLDTCDGWTTCRPKYRTNYTMTDSDWDAINVFCSNTGLRLLFDFNVFLRDGKAWSVDNARALLEQSVRKNYTNNLDYELGNEPNAYWYNFNISMSGQQLGQDYLTLYSLVNNITSHVTTTRSRIVGPGITRPKGRHSKSTKYLEKFLPVAKKVVDAVTWHQYYMNGRTAVVDNFTDPAVLDLLKGQLTNIHRALQATQSQNVKLWLGETSSAWGGGAKGLSDTYVAGFMWLDKLGLAALGGVDTVMRQTFYGGNYALIDNNLQPRPDYWLSLLFKRLVGRRVLSLTTERDANVVRLYAHCTNTLSYAPGSITLYGMNLKENDVTLSLIGDLEAATLYVYLLTPHTEGKLTSRLMRLNGKTLKMLDDETFPDFVPKKLKSDKQFTLPSKSFGFFVIEPTVDMSDNICH